MRFELSTVEKQNYLGLISTFFSQDECKKTYFFNTFSSKLGHLFISIPG